MKKILYVLFPLLFIWVIYLLTAYSLANPNLLKWDSPIRIGFSIVSLILTGVGIVLAYHIYNDD